VRVARPAVPRILLPFKITVKGALRRVGAAHRRPLSSDLARQTHWHLSGWTGQSVDRFAVTSETGKRSQQWFMC
jgi:hypothetical protein